MTVIAYKDGVVAADSQETHGDGRKQSCKKLYKVNGTVIATAGDSYTSLIFVDWFERGARMEDCPDLSNVSWDEDFECLVLESQSEIYTINRFFQKYYIEMPDGFFAIGCGAGYATVAMDCGLSAKEAVKMTCKHDAYCGGRVQSMRVKP